jgi:hypothetical protein
VERNRHLGEKHSGVRAYLVLDSIGGEAFYSTRGFTFVSPISLSAEISRVPRIFCRNPGVTITEECQGACVREICITNEVPDYVSGKEPSLRIIGGQEFDDAEPVLLILTVGSKSSLRFVPDIAVHLVREFWVKTRGTRTVQPKARSFVFSVVPYRALQSDRCLVITT